MGRPPNTALETDQIARFAGDLAAQLIRSKDLAEDADLIHSWNQILRLFHSQIQGLRLSVLPRMAS